MVSCIARSVAQDWMGVNLAVRPLVAFILLAVLPVQARTIYVSTSGSDSSGTGSSGAPYRTVAKAHSVAANGDVIRISAGRYGQPVSLTKRLSVQAYNGPVTLGYFNQAPVVNAGSDQRIEVCSNIFNTPGGGFTPAPGAAGLLSGSVAPPPPNVISLIGSVGDDGLPTPSRLSVAWTKVTGPDPCYIGPANQTATGVRFTAPGHYVLRLTASDGEKSSFDDVTVDVVSDPCTNPPPPVVYYTAPREAGVGQPVTVAGTYRNFTCAPSPHWHFYSGPAVPHIVSPNAWVTTVIFPREGRYYLQLFGQCGSESNSYAGVGIWITNGVPTTSMNAAPVVSAGPDQTIVVSSVTQLPVTVNLRGAATDDGRPNPPGRLTNLWSKVSGPGTSVFSSRTATNSTVRLDTLGTYEFELRCGDGALLGNDRMFVIVNLRTGQGTNSPPVANAGPDLTVPLEEACGFFGCTNWATVAINGTVTDDGNPNPPHRLTAAWSVVSGPGRVDFENRNSAATRATFYVAGHYILRLTGDDSALKGTDDVIVQITSTARPFIRLYEDRNRLCGIDGNELWAENTNTSKTIVFTVRLRYANQLGDEWEELPTFTLSPRQKTYVACTGRGETHWLVNYWLEAANFATGTVLAGSGTLLTQYGLRLADGLLSLDGGFVDWGTVLYDPAPLMSVAESDPRLIAQGVMELRLYGQPDVLYTIQVSSDLRNWTTLTTVLGDTIPVVVRDTQAGANRLRFCRALKP